MATHEDYDHVSDILYYNGINAIEYNIPEITEQLMEKYGVFSALDVADEDIVAAAKAANPLF